jgi:RNA polymerase sigma-70 factor (ECF subfamily)
MLPSADAESLFAAHRQQIFRYLSRIIGGGETARDLTQEVFLRVSRSSVPAADPSSQRAWLFRIARNLALNHLRDGRRQPATVDLVERAIPPVQELGVAVRQALAALADLDRDVFLLRESAGLSYGEIAVACDLTMEAVRARLHRARVELRARLAAPMRLQRSHPVRFGGGDHHD